MAEVFHKFCGKSVEINGWGRPNPRDFLKIREFAQDFVMAANLFILSQL